MEVFSYVFIFQYSYISASLLQVKPLQPTFYGFEFSYRPLQFIVSLPYASLIGGCLEEYVNSPLNTHFHWSQPVQLCKWAPGCICKTREEVECWAVFSCAQLGCWGWSEISPTKKQYRLYNLLRNILSVISFIVYPAAVSAQVFLTGRSL